MPAPEDECGFIFDAPGNIYLGGRTPPPASSPYEVLAAAGRLGFRHASLDAAPLKPAERDALADYARRLGIKITGEVLCAQERGLPSPEGLREAAASWDAVRLTVPDELLSDPSLARLVKDFRRDAPNLPLHLRFIKRDRPAAVFFRELRELGVEECELVFPYAEGAGVDDDLKNIVAVLKQGNGVRIRQRTLVPPPGFDPRMPIIHQPELLYTHSDGGRHDIAVVVPFYNKRDIVEHVADALLRQTLAPSRFEVVFVDDGSDDATAARLVRHLARRGGGHNVKVLHLPRAFKYCPGSAYFTAGWARNAGAHHSSADVVLFLDGDMLAAPALAASHLRAHEFHGGAAVMGDRIHLNRHARADAVCSMLAGGDLPEHDPALVEPKEPGSVCRRLDEGAAWEAVDEFPWSTCASCNVSVPSGLLGRAGLFDPYATVWALDDTEFFFRLHRAGARFVYAPEAKGYHCWHPSAGVGTIGGEDTLLLRNVAVYFRKYLEPEILRANAYLLSDELNQML